MNATRILKPSEHLACFVGSGECLVPATHGIDDGAGNEVYVCLMHLVEFERMEKLVEEMSPEMVKKFSDAVDNAHQQEKDRKP